MREKWLDCMRGVAIIAVVTEHMMRWTHHSELIQSFTLFCVTILILCMGITMRWGLEKSVKNNIFATQKIYVYIIKKMIPVLGAYFIATIAYLTYHQTWRGYDFGALALHLVNFDASDPFYFIRHYINLTLWAPIIFFFLKNIQRVKCKCPQFVLYLLLLGGCLGIGHASVGKAGYTSESYLFAYALGMSLGGLNIKDKANTFGIIGVPALLGGYFSTYKFYMARVYEQNNAYAEGIDFLLPNFQLNPPNLSILIYSIGVFCFLLFLFCKIERKKFGNIILEGLGIIGKNSLDIFLWHMLILDIITSCLGSILISQFLINIILYSAVLVVPVLGRNIYIKMKNSLYAMLLNGDSQ